MKGIIATVGMAMAMVLVTLPASHASMLASTDFVPVEIFDENGELILVQEVDPENPLLIKTTHYYRLSAMEESTDENNGNGNGKGGGGGGDGGGGGGGGTDCASTAYKTTGWYWDQSYSGYADSYASQASSAGNAWDAETSAGIFGGISSGKRGEAGTYDGVNQLEWEHIGTSSTVAVTTTWSYRGSGLAVESDGQYNTYYPWSTNGDPNSMDVQGVATHEVGHTFGLDHPNGKGAECLTMYAYVNYGETHQRTLGDGDILGIQAIYGA